MTLINHPVVQCNAVSTRRYSWCNLDSVAAIIADDAERRLRLVRTDS